MLDTRGFPPLDLYAIELPSDHVTLGRARKLDQAINGDGVFSDASRLNSARALEIFSLIPLWYEMKLAEKAYAKALGLADPHPRSTRAELVSVLRERWIEGGVSSGTHQSTQLIRDIEKAARAQAEAHLGKGR